MQMCKLIELTEKEFEILEYVYQLGGNNVQVASSDVKQNKNFYQRVRKIEQFEYIIVSRSEGCASSFTITEKGKEYVKNKKTSIKEDSNSDNEFFISLINHSSLSNKLKKKLITYLS